MSITKILINQLKTKVFLQINTNMILKIKLLLLQWTQEKCNNLKKDLINLKINLPQFNLELSSKAKVHQKTQSKLKKIILHLLRK